MITSTAFGRLPDGSVVDLYELRNARGFAVEILTYGGAVRALRVPDRAGRRRDVTLGFDTLAGYLGRNPFFGAIVGRIAGRVPGGVLTIDGQRVQLPCNDGPNHIHGGACGFDKRLWRVRAVHDRGADGGELRLNYLSPDGEQQYPGNVDTTVSYRLDADGGFTVATEAAADAPTPVSLTHHSYFNLEGETSPGADGHRVQIFAEAFAEVDDHLSLTGRRLPLAGQPADLRRERRVGEAVPHLHRRHGDLYFLHPAECARPDAPVRVARLHAPASGIVMEVFTDEACLQFYTASHFDGTLLGKNGRAYGAQAGLCFECQGYPDATHHPAWGDIFVRPGCVQRRTTRYQFSHSP